MKVVYRKTFFWSAVLLFLVAAPLLILNASGFRYDFQEKSLIQTGTLVLKTRPAGARVWLEQKEQDETTPAEIERLLPQRYAVRIEADNFHPWQKEVEVRQAEITLNDQILLVPKRLPLVPVVSEGVRTFALAPDGRHLVYTRRDADRKESVWLRHLDEKSEALLFTLKNDEDAHSVDRLLWSSDNQHLAAAASSREGDLKRYFLTGAEPGDSVFEIVLPGREDSAQWNWSEDGKRFFFLHRQVLYQADPVRRTIEEVVSEKVTGFTTAGADLYFVSEDDRGLFKKRLGAQEAPILLHSIRSEEGKEDPKKEDHLILSSDGKMALLDRAGRLSMVDLNADPETETKVYPIASDVESARFSEDGRRLLYQTAKALVVHHRSDAIPDWGAKAGATEMLVRQSKPAIGTVWYGDQAHVLYSSGETVYIAEAGEKPIIYPLIRTPGESPRFVYHHEGDDLLYLLYRETLYRADLSFEEAAPALPVSDRSKHPAAAPGRKSNGLFERIQGGANEQPGAAPSSPKGRS